MSDLRNPIVDTPRMLREGMTALSRKVRSERVRRDSGMRANRLPSILIVEDDPHSQTSLFRAFQARQGFDVAVATTIGAARRAVSGDAPWDVICSDLNMGSDDGAEFVRELLLSGARSKIVVSSGLDERGMRERLGSDAAARVVLREKDDILTLVDDLCVMASSLAAERAVR